MSYQIHKIDHTISRLPLKLLYITIPLMIKVGTVPNTPIILSNYFILLVVKGRSSLIMKKNRSKRMSSL